MLTVVRILISLAVAGLVLGLFGASMIQEALHAARLRTVATQIEVKLPKRPAEAKPGEIVLVTGTMQGEALNLGPDNPHFPGAFIVIRNLDRQTGMLRKRWRMVETQRWISPTAQLGAWPLSYSVYNSVLDGDRGAQAQREFTAPRSIRGAPIQARNLSIHGNALEFIADGITYRLDYRIWGGNAPFTVLAQVADQNGTLVPFRVPGLQGSMFSAMAKGAHQDLSFLLELSHRDVLSNLGILVLITGTGALAWYMVLRRIWEQSFLRTVGDSLWRSAAMVAPMMLIAFWPATNTSFIWIAAASVGGAAGVLFLLIGLVYAEWTE